MNEKTVTVVYFGEETENRRKQCGLSLIEQLLLSIRSIRQNWSKSVDIHVYHFWPLSSATQLELTLLGATIYASTNLIESQFPLSNKILIGNLYNGNKDILFLDCDTVVHYPVEIATSFEMMVAYDVIKNVDKKDYIEIARCILVELPKIDIYESPAFEYYYYDNIKQFPVFNSGVFFLSKRLQQLFYNEYKKIFFSLYKNFKNHAWNFYIEQISFCMTIIKLKIKYSLFPKGFNFICTPRADFLKNWDKQTVVIEHYAGNNGSPFSFE